MTFDGKLANITVSTVRDQNCPRSKSEKKSPGWNHRKSKLSLSLFSYLLILSNATQRHISTSPHLIPHLHCRQVFLATSHATV